MRGKPKSIRNPVDHWRLRRQGSRLQLYGFLCAVELGVDAGLHEVNATVRPMWQTMAVASEPSPS